MRQLILLLLLLLLLASHPHVHGDAVIRNIGITMCEARCHYRSSCQSFAYNLNTLTCRLSRQEATTRKMKGYIIRSKGKQLLSGSRCSLATCTSGSLSLENHRGRAVCVKVPPIPYTLGKVCSATVGCWDSGLICYDGRCKCTPGYSFNYAREKCVRRCRKYGRQMTMYRGLDMLHHNTVTRTMSSLKKCIALCIRQKTFVCLTVEFSKTKRKCNLSKEGYLDIRVSRRNKGDKIWTLGNRNCA